MNKIITTSEIFLDIDLNTSEQVFDFIGQQAFERNICTNKSGLIEKLKEREEISSTGFEKGVAIPHTQYEEVTTPKLFFLRLKNEVDWKAMDGEPTKMFFCIMVPKGDGQGLHIEILGNLASKLLEQKFIDTLLNSNDKEELLNLILENKTQDEATTSDIQKDFYVAVVACTFGLAHTYLAEQKLIKFAKDNNFEIKVETYGAKGHQNIINDQDLKKAKGVLIAIDKDVDIKHIKHKNIYTSRTIDAINDTEKIFKILDGEISISRTKQVFSNFFKMKLPRSASFSYGKTYNYIRFFALALGILMFIQQFLSTKNWLIDNDIIPIISYASLIVTPMVCGLIIYSFTKSESNSAVAGLIILGINVYQTFSKGTNFNLGFFGGLAIALLAIIYTKYIYASLKKLFKIRKINGGFRWLFEIIYFFALLAFTFYTAAFFAKINNQIFSWLVEYNNNHWWFRWIIASIFFILMVLDMGGPINKWGLIISTLLMVETFGVNPQDVWLTPITAQVIGITMPGFSLWVRGILLNKVLNVEEKQLSNESGKKAFNGISEGALWMIKKYKYKAHLVNILLGIYTGFIIGFLNIKTYGGYNTILGSIFGFSTDNFLELFDIHYQSINLGFLVMTFTGPIVGGLLGSAILWNKNPINKG